MIDTASSPATSCQDSMKLQKIVKVLMDQVERGIDFRKCILLVPDRDCSRGVRERTRRLETALRELEKNNRELSIAKEQTETAQTRLMEAVEHFRGLRAL